MAGPSYSEFSAADSMLGYIYQIEYALYHLLDRDLSVQQISVETLDDIVEGDINDPEALLQLKLHSPTNNGSLKNFTDRCPDFWKTLRIWSTLVSRRLVNPAQTTFFLLTTSRPGDGSLLANYLAPAKSEVVRKVDEALTRIDVLAAEILADTELDKAGPLPKGASAFAALSQAEKSDLVRNITVVTSVPPVQNLRKLIDRRLKFSGVTRENHGTFVEIIIGWWYELCIQHIGKENGGMITADALDQKIAESAKIFAVASLNHDCIINNPSNSELENLNDRLFVNQITRIGYPRNGQLTGSAKVDYYKADGYRKKWLEKMRVNKGELRDFESDLKGIWATNFGNAEVERDDCESKSEPEKCLQKLGRSVYEATINASAPTFKGFDGAFLARGTFHIMANTPDIGWHPYWDNIFHKGSRK